MTVVQIALGSGTLRLRRGRFEMNGEEVNPREIPELVVLFKVGVLCNESRLNGRNPVDGRQDFRGSATENALMCMAQDGDMDIEALRSQHPLEQLTHRSETRLFMYTRHRTSEGKTLICLKGSPSEVLALCDRQMVGGRIIPLTEADAMAIEMQNEKMAGKALRNLGMAYRLDPASTDPVPVSKDDTAEEARLIWLGLVGMVDPLREGLVELVERFHGAGINSVMITGDQSSTAFAIAEELNLSGEQPLKILDSTQLTALNLETLTAISAGVNVYARVSPAHKLRIVQALQQSGQVVGMTGDGINDGPALKAADIGIAMGESGTDVARDVAEIVLKEDNLESLMIAVREGRATYSNIRKSVRFFLATNFSEIMVLLASMGLGIGFPINVMQLLWINLISDIFPGLALSMEPPEGDVLQHPPRANNAPIFNRRDYQRMTAEAATISAGSLGAYLYGLGCYGAGVQAGTLAFQSLTTSQLLHALACRSETRKAKGTDGEEASTPSNPYLTVAVGGSLLLQVLTAIWPPMRRFLGLNPMSLTDTAVVGGAALVPLFINQNSKPTLS
jgi:Ca2+-transporting ATPase